MLETQGRRAGEEDEKIACTLISLLPLSPHADASLDADRLQVIGAREGAIRGTLIAGGLMALYEVSFPPFPFSTC